MSSSDHAFWDAVDHIRESGSPYRREAYGFVVAALGAAVAGLPEARRDDPERRHLSGAELLAAVLALARQEFGGMAPTVFHEWGVRSGEDVGNIVFHLVAAGQLSARPEDTMAEFMGVPDLLGTLGCGVEPGSPGAPRRSGGAAGA